MNGRAVSRMLLRIVWLGLVVLAGPPLIVVADDLKDQRLERWVWNIGGRSSLRGAPVLAVRGRIEPEGQPGTVVPSVLHIMADGRFRNEFTRPDFGKVVEAFDGTTGWRYNKQLGSGLILPDEVTERTHWDDLYLALNYREMFPTRIELPDEAVDGRWYHVFEMHPRQGPPERWYLDYTSGLLHARVRAPTEQTLGMMMTLGDYRKVSGRLKLPYEVTTYSAAGKVVLYREEIRIKGPPPAVLFKAPAKVAAQAAEARAILDRHLAASGGLEAVRKIKSRVTTGQIEDGIMGVTHSLKISQLSPHFLLTESEAPGLGRTLQGFDGTTAWAFSDVEGYRELKGGALTALLASVSLLSQTQLRDRFPLAVVLEPVVVEGGPAARLQLASWGGPAGVYWFDLATGHMIRAETTMAAGALGAVDVTLEFSDFREVDGVVMPFVTTSTNPAAQTMTTLLRVEHDVPLDPAIFAPRKDG